MGAGDGDADDADDSVGDANGGGGGGGDVWSWLAGRAWDDDDGCPKRRAGSDGRGQGRWPGGDGRRGVRERRATDGPAA